MNDAPYRVADSYGLEKCPHCRGLTAAQKHENLGWACGACGKPVIPGVDATRLDVGAQGSLRAAAETLALTYKEAAFTPVIALCMLALIAFLHAGPRLLLALFVLAALVSARRFVSIRKRRVAAALAHVADAQLGAAAVLARERGGKLTAKQLADTTRVPLAEAELLLTRLSVDRGAVNLDADQQLHYRVDASEPLDSELEVQPAPAKHPHHE